MNYVLMTNNSVVTAHDGRPPRVLAHERRHPVHALGRKHDRVASPQPLDRGPDPRAVRRKQHAAAAGVLAVEQHAHRQRRARVAVRRIAHRPPLRIRVILDRPHVRVAAAEEAPPAAALDDALARRAARVAAGPVARVALVRAVQRAQKLRAQTRRAIIDLRVRVQMHHAVRRHGVVRVLDRGPRPVRARLRRRRSAVGVEDRLRERHRQLFFLVRVVVVVVVVALLALLAVVLRALAAKAAPAPARFPSLHPLSLFFLLVLRARPVRPFEARRRGEQMQRRALGVGEHVSHDGDGLRVGGDAPGAARARRRPRRPPRLHAHAPRRDDEDAVLGVRLVSVHLPSVRIRRARVEVVERHAVAVIDARVQGFDARHDGKRSRRALPLALQPRRYRAQAVSGDEDDHDRRRGRPRRERVVAAQDALRRGGHVREMPSAQGIHDGPARLGPRRAPPQARRVDLHADAPASVPRGGVVKDASVAAP
eukprot:30677-Pelagococcus_subviridis.AAC.8